MSLAGFVGADFGRIADLWSRFFPERYRVDEDLLIQNTVGCPTFDWGASAVSETPLGLDGFVVLKRSPHRLYRHPDQDLYHLSAIAFEEPTVGLDLLSQAKRILRDRGASCLVFGQDSRHFFPGVPEECGRLRDFLTIEGFTASGSSMDLERDLADYAYAGPTPEGDEFRRLGARDLTSLRRFLSAEFPGRWEYDVMKKVEIEGPDTVFGLVRGGEVRGFALLQRDGARSPVGGAVWRTDLGPDWGALGPIGIAQEFRGGGHGGALLGRALESLRDAGARRTIIDWTTLDRFYGREGFVPTRRYTGMTLSFEEFRKP